MEKEASVVVAVDLSEISPAVVRAGLTAAHRLGGACLVVHAVEALTGEEAREPLARPLRRWAQTVQAEAAESLERLLDAFRTEHGELLRGEILPGKPVEEVLGRSREMGASLVVIGGPPPTRSLGSRALGIVRRSPVAVLVVRRPPAHGYRELLVGVDFTPESEVTWDAALRLAEKGARVTACHVVSVRRGPKPSELSETSPTPRARLERWVASRRGGGSVALRVESGQPKHVLLEVATEIGADLLAVGSGGRKQLARRLLGSVAGAAARRAACDVLVAGRGWPVEESAKGARDVS